jgi:hypothetical protein
MQAEAQIVRGLFRMQPVCSGCVNRDERLLASGASDLREVGESGKPVRVGAHALGRVFRTFRDFRCVKRDQIGCRAFVQIERALLIGA